MEYWYSNIYFNHMSKAWCGVILLYIVNVLVKSSCHDTTIRTETHQHILCKVNWFFQHEHHRYYDYPVEVWSKHFYSFSSGSYMPVFRITSHCATLQVRFSVYTPTNLHEYAQTLPQSLFWASFHCNSALSSVAKARQRPRGRGQGLHNFSSKGYACIYSLVPRPPQAFIDCSMKSGKAWEILKYTWPHVDTRWQRVGVSEVKDRLPLLISIVISPVVDKLQEYGKEQWYAEEVLQAQSRGMAEKQARNGLPDSCYKHRSSWKLHICHCRSERKILKQQRQNIHFEFISLWRILWAV